VESEVENGLYSSSDTLISNGLRRAVALSLEFEISAIPATG